MSVLKSRTPAVVEGDAAGLEVRLKHANAIAAAGQALPQAYVNKPGAILLAQEWAQHRGLDLLTTIQSVSFIGGRPVVDATMQRALAMRAGYEIDITVDDKSATCSLSRDGKPCGSSTYTVDDAKTAGLLGKDNWKKNPKAMLVARATAQTMRWHAPDVMVGVFAEDEIEDPVETLEPVAEPVDDTVDAEIVEDGGPQPVEGEQPAASACTQETWAEIKALELDPIDQDALKAWVEGQGWTFTRRGLTEDQAQQVLAWRPAEVPGQQTIDGGEVA